MRAALHYFALVFGAGFLLGSIRVPLLVPRLGERHAELLEMPLMLLVIVFAARWTVARHQLHPLAALRSGLGALVLLLGAELTLAMLLQGRTPADYLASRDPVSGSVYLLMLLVFLFMPAIVARNRRFGS